MSKQRSLQMDDRFDRFIDERVGSEDYETAEDVVRAGLRLLEQDERNRERRHPALAKTGERPLSLEELRQAIREGEDSGEAVELDVDAMFKDIIAEAAQGR